MDIISIFRNLELEFAVYYISKTGKSYKYLPVFVVIYSIVFNFI